MVALPVELWLYIAEFVPPHERRRLVGVNQLFFELIMSELYSQLSFISADPKIFCDKLRSLQGPTGSLADRVRSLTIWPNAIRDALKAEELDRQEEKKRKRQKHSRHPSHLIQKGLERVEELFGRSSSKELVPWVIPPPSGSIPSPAERLRMFHEAVRNLTRVEEYEINWYVDHGGEDFGWKFPFFKEIWQGIGTNLRRVTMDIQLFKMEDVLASTGPLPNVQELNLTLRTEVSGDKRFNDTAVPYFINKLARSLQILSIKTIGHQELSFFRLLGEFPLLTKLSLIMPLDSYHLPDPLGFQQLLRNHPQLRTLCVRYSRCCRDLLQDGFCRPQGRHLLYSDITMPVLHTLELGLHIPVPSSTSLSTINSSSNIPDPLAMIYAISGLAESLNTLILKDRSLTLQEIRTVLVTFRGAKRLKKLCMYARRITPQLVDLVARECPVLSIWEVDVEKVLRSEMTKPGVGCDAQEVQDFATALASYAVDLDDDRWRYKNWTLSDISVMKWEFKVGHQYNWACMKAIADVVPSVRSFAGRGVMLWGESDEDLKVRKSETMERAGGSHLGVDYGERGMPFDT